MSKKQKGIGAGPAGSVARRSARGRQVIDHGGSRWSDEAETRFIDELGASCNVRRAARTAGFSTSTAYRRRLTDASFAEAWGAALAQGFDRLEMLLVQRATETLEGKLPDPDHPIPAITVAETIRILQLHRAEVRGAGAGRPGHVRPRSLDEMSASIITKLEAIEVARRVEAVGRRDAG